MGAGWVADVPNNLRYASYQAIPQRKYCHLLNNLFKSYYTARDSLRLLGCKTRQKIILSIRHGREITHRKR